MEKYDKRIIHRIEQRLNISFRQLSDQSKYLLYRSEQRIIRNEERQKKLVVTEKDKASDLTELQKSLLEENELLISEAEARDELIINMSPKRKLTGPEKFQLKDTSERIAREKKRYWQIIENPQNNEDLMERVYEKLGKMNLKTIADKNRSFFADYEKALSYRESLRDEALKLLDHDWLQPMPFADELGRSRTNLYNDQVRKDYHKLTRELFSEKLPHKKQSELENEIDDLTSHIHKMETRDADYAELLTEKEYLKKESDEIKTEYKNQIELNRQRNIENENLRSKLNNANLKLDKIREDHPDIVI